MKGFFSHLYASVGHFQRPETQGYRGPQVPRTRGYMKVGHLRRPYIFFYVCTSDNKMYHGAESAEYWVIVGAQHTYSTHPLPCSGR